MESVDRTRILKHTEVSAVIADLKRRSKRSVNSWQNLIVFRLSCCCGLRRIEIAGLEMSDFIFQGPCPTLRIRKEITKGQEGKRRARKVPLDWDKGSLADLKAWHIMRKQQGAKKNDPFICYVRPRGFGNKQETYCLSRRWRTAIRVLGPDRVKQLSIHSGRHSFISHALNVGHSLAEVMDAAGHDNVHTTSLYLHAIRNDLPDLFPSKESDDE